MGCGCSESTVLRKRCGPGREEVTGEWRRLHSEKLHDLYFSVHIIRAIKTEMGWACGRYGGEHQYIQDFVGKSEGNRLFARLRR
jgi:hypothetical protein